MEKQFKAHNCKLIRDLYNVLGYYSEPGTLNLETKAKFKRNQIVELKAKGVKARGNVFSFRNGILEIVSKLNLRLALNLDDGDIVEILACLDND